MTLKSLITDLPLFEAIPKANKNGDCYEVAYKYFNSKASNKKLRLVHGLVRGQGALEGIIYNHAWVEDGNKIIDMTLDKKVQKSLPKVLYYAIGQIKVTYEYTYSEHIEKVNEYGTYGPWEKKLLSNKY